MTSVEFVIWMRGFMECHPVGYDMSSRRADAIRDALGKVDGVPMPREKRTNLRPPTPLVLAADVGVNEVQADAAGAKALAGRWWAVSYTILAVATAGKPFKGEYEFRNGWGSAPFIWDRIARRYKIGADANGKWQFGSDSPGMDAWEKVWRYHQDGGQLDPFESNALSTTYDNTVVERSQMLTVADSFERFVAAHPPGDRVCSLLDQARSIREAHENGAEFLAWTQTSVGESWWVEYDAEHDRSIGYDPRNGTKHTVATILPLVPVDG